MHRKTAILDGVVAHARFGSMLLLPARVDGRLYVCPEDYRRRRGLLGDTISAVAGRGLAVAAIVVLLVLFFFFCVVKLHCTGVEVDLNKGE